MPAIRIATEDKDLAEKTFRTIIKCGYDFLPEEIYIVRERDFEWLVSKGLPIEVLSDEAVRKSVAEYKRKKGLA